MAVLARLKDVGFNPYGIHWELIRVLSKGEQDSKSHVRTMTAVAVSANNRLGRVLLKASRHIGNCCNISGGNNEMLKLGKWE
jgi:hypothetical protein